MEETVTTNRKLVSIDETIFLAKDRRLKAWSCTNLNVCSQFQGNFQPNVTVIAAPDNNNLVYFEKFKSIWTKLNI